MKEAPNLELFGEVPLPAPGDGPGWWVSAGGRDVPVCRGPSLVERSGLSGTGLQDEDSGDEGTGGRLRV